METHRDISPVSLQKSVAIPLKSNEELYSSQLRRRKNRFQLSALITQEKFCTFYPSNIKRCVDCQTGSSKSCRFQHCRKLTFLGDNRFEFGEFSNVTEAKMLSKPNSGGQPAFTLIDAQYVLLRIGKLFSSMFLHEEHERSKKNESKRETEKKTRCHSIVFVFVLKKISFGNVVSPDGEKFVINV